MLPSGHADDASISRRRSHWSSRGGRDGSAPSPRGRIRRRSVPSARERVPRCARHGRTASAARQQTSRGGGVEVPRELLVRLAMETTARRRGSNGSIEDIGRPDCRRCASTGTDDAGRPGKSRKAWRLLLRVSYARSRRGHRRRETQVHRRLRPCKSGLGSVGVSARPPCRPTIRRGTDGAARRVLQLVGDLRDRRARASYRMSRIVLVERRHDSRGMSASTKPKPRTRRTEESQPRWRSISPRAPAGR